MGNTPGGPGRVGRQSQRSGTEWVGGICPEVQDGSGDHPKGPGRVGGPLGWFGTGRETLVKVQDGLAEPSGDLGRVG